eukprot:GHVU01020419.1.p1 GENE.GHVU01020419.1~~GHVU01020419.1.p1  ORF type:complete len:460 (+),score=47.48 GHVU01020419.1:561-1940(+)
MTPAVSVLSGFIDRSIRNRDIGKFVSFVGTVIRFGTLKMLEEARCYVCEECSYCFQVEASPELYYLIDAPKECPSSAASQSQAYVEVDADDTNDGAMTQKRVSVGKGRGGKKGGRPSAKRRRGAKTCKSRSFKEVEGQTIRTDYRELRVQESVTHATRGAAQRVISVAVKGDMAGNHLVAGREVIVNGLLWRRWRALREERRCEVELFVEANEITENSAADTRDTEAYSSHDRDGSPEGRPLLDESGERLHEEDGNSNTKSIGAGTFSTPRRHRKAAAMFNAFWHGMNRSDEFAGRKELIKAVCPSLQGLLVPKLALLLTLIGGGSELLGNESTSHGKGEGRIGMPSATGEASEPPNRWRKHLANANQVADTDASRQGDELGDSLANLTDDNFIASSSSREMGSNLPPPQGEEPNSQSSTRKGRVQGHLLFVGDTGTGKTQLLNAAAELSETVVRITGR